ncbi:MAG TPA: MFS transporter [Acidimicrobiales bacterium]|nr:MFS transporter [Acidimicrobiales bacterium]
MTTAPSRAAHGSPARSAPGHAASPYTVLAIVLTATFVQLVDISIVNVAIPSIQRDLHASYAAVQLVIAGYQLAFAVVLITAARLGDIHGRRRLFMIGMLGFTAMSALCGAAPSSTVLVLARIAQGAFSGLMFPQVLAVIQVTFAPRDRGKAFAVYGATIGLATIMGPLLGGALIALNLFGMSWRLIFYVNLPIGVGALIAARLRLGESRAPDAPRLDIPGAIMATAALFLLVYPLTEGRQDGWPWWILLMLLCSAPVGVVFVLYERRRTAERRSPLVHTTLFSEPAFRAGIILALVFFAGVAPFFFTLSLYLQIGYGYSALHAGLTTFPFAVASGLAASLSDRASRRLGRNVLSVGCGLLCVSMIGTAIAVDRAGTDLRAWYLLPGFIVGGAGLGLFTAPMTNVILARIHSAQAGTASGVLSTVQQVGGALGVAIIGVILFGLLGGNADSAARSTLQSVDATLRAQGLPPPAIAEVNRRFVTCFHDRATENDPSVVPASCRPPTTGASPEVRSAVASGLAAAGQVALEHDFGRSFRDTLGYEVAVYAVAFGLVFLLPRDGEAARA